MKITLNRKLTVGFTIAAAVVIGLALLNWVKLADLAAMQDVAAHRAEDARFLQEVAGMGAKGYEIIADSVINRDLGACRANSRAGDRHLDRGPYLIAHGEGLPAVRHRSATASAA